MNILITASKYYLTILILFVFAQNSFSQTSALGNYEIYEHKTSSTGLGYFTTTTPFIDSLNNIETKQKGLLFVSKYAMGEISSFVINSSQRIRIFTEGAFRAGLASGGRDASIITAKQGRKFLKYYISKLDVFSLNIGSEYTYVFSEGYAFTAKATINVVNIGGTLAFPEGGTFQEDAMGTIDIIPLTFEPSVLFDLGRAAIGFSFYLNSSTFLAYKIVPESYFNKDEKGLRISDDTVRKFAVELLFSF